MLGWRERAHDERAHEHEHGASKDHLFSSQRILSPKAYPKLSETPRGAAEALPKFLTT